MRDYVKLFWMTVIGFITAILIYPFFHESGHTIASIMSGAEILEFNLYPLPYVLCNVSNVNNMAQVTMGLSGLIFPAFISVIWYSRQFYIWYLGMILRGIILISAVYSIIVTILDSRGKIVENDDITQVLTLWEDGSFWILSGSVFTIIVMFVLISNDKPIYRILREFNLEDV